MAQPSALVTGAVEELTGLDLGDARLDRRARQLVAALARDPAAGLPSAVDTVAEREAAYRLLGNERVSLAGLLAPHIAQTVQRSAACDGRPLVVVDKTTFVFAGESPRAGLARLGPARQGFDAFVALSVTAARAPLGVLAVVPVAGAGRAKPEAWADVAAAAHAHVGAQQPIYVMDREADAYALFAAMAATARDFIIRIRADRWIHEAPAAVPELLRTVLARTPQLLTRTVTLTRRSGVTQPRATRRRHPPRTTRVATLAIHAATVVVPRPPKVRGAAPATLTLHLVQVVERDPPADVVPVEWLLVTTLPVDTPAAVEAVVDGYRARWIIEEYFKALKTGCAYEQRQLESRATLLAALGLLAPLAWRLLALRTAARETTTPASALLAADELHVLRQLARDVTLSATPTAAEALLALARIGGHFPQNGPPGWQTLWRGFQKLNDRVDGYRLARAEHAGRCDQ